MRARPWGRSCPASAQRRRPGPAGCFAATPRPHPVASRGPARGRGHAAPGLGGRLCHAPAFPSPASGQGPEVAAEGA
eukprot:11160178-Lingulodinium_polyedra.AAC.1